MIHVNINANEINKSIKTFNGNLKRADKESKRAVQSVLNRGLTSIRKSAVKESSTAIGVSQKVIRRRFSFKRASPGKLRIIIRASTKAINAVVAGAKQTDEGLKLGAYEWDSAFTILSPKTNRKIGVKRVGKKRFPIVPQVIGKGFVYREMKAALDSAANHFINVVYQRELAKELNKRYRRILK